MNAISGKELSRILKSRGWQLMRIHGSHHIYGKADSIIRLSVPTHGNHPIKVGLLKHLLKMAGIPWPPA